MTHHYTTTDSANKMLTELLLQLKINTEYNAGASPSTIWLPNLINIESDTSNKGNKTLSLSALTECIQNGLLDFYRDAKKEVMLLQHASMVL